MSRTFLGKEVPTPKLFLLEAEKQRRKAKIKNLMDKDKPPTDNKNPEEQKKAQEEPQKPEFDDSVTNIYSFSFQGSSKRKCNTVVNDASLLKKVRMFEPKDLLGKEKEKVTIKIAKEEEKKEKVIEPKLVKDVTNVGNKDIMEIKKNKNEEMKKINNVQPVPLEKEKNKENAVKGNTEQAKLPPKQERLKEDSKKENKEKDEDKDKGLDKKSKRAKKVIIEDTNNERLENNNSIQVDKAKNDTEVPTTGEKENEEKEGEVEVKSAKKRKVSKRKKKEENEENKENDKEEKEKKPKRSKKVSKKEEKENDEAQENEGDTEAKPVKSKTSSKKKTEKSNTKSKKKEVYDLNKPQKFSNSRKVFKKSATENYVRYDPKKKYKDRFRGGQQLMLSKYRPNGKFKFRKKFNQQQNNEIQGVPPNDLDLNGEEEEKDEHGLTARELREKILVSRIQSSKFLSPGLSQSLETQENPEIELEKDLMSMDESDHCKILKEHFGHTNFKPCQFDAIKRVLQGQSTLVILNTGSGKSLTYQYSSLLMKGITIVISPLMSLIVDQLQKLPLALRGASLNSSLTYEERKKVLSLVSEGKVRILYLSPEYVSIETFDNFPQINFVCVDEVHCMSEWSHNFRTSYFFLKSNIKKKIGDVCFLGLTATATKNTQNSILSLLGLTRECIIWNTSKNKDLVLSVSRDRDVFRGVLNLLKSSKFNTLTSIIVYCSMRRVVDGMAQFLNSNGIRAVAYHADKTEAQRIRIQEDFMKSKYRVIVATIAFGMGIDKQDVQAVIHVSLPQTLENYVQEIGRAGRNGKTAHCHLFLNDDDYYKSRNILYSEFVEENVIKLLVNKLLAPGLGHTEAELEKKPIFSIKVSELLEQFDLKLETITTIIARIGQCENQFFKLLGITKLKCIVGFYKSDPEVLKETSPFVATFIESAKKVRGNYTINLCKLANQMGCSIENCINELRVLIKAGEISYQLEDEGFTYLLNFIPKPEELNEIIASIYQKIRAIETLSLQKIDMIYYVMRVSAQPSVEFMLKNGDLESMKNLDVKIDNKEETFELEIEPKIESDLMVQGNAKIQDLIEKYFKADDISNLDGHFGNDEKKQEVLPIYFIAEEERPDIINDIMNFIRGQPDIYFSADSTQRDINSLSSRKVLKILQGVNSKHTPIIEWKNNPYWGKYRDYESHSLETCIKDAVLIRLLESTKIGQKEPDVQEPMKIDGKENEIQESVVEQKENDIQEEHENMISSGSPKSDPIDVE